MRKLIYILFATLVALVSCNTADYESILEQLRDHENRIQKLEALCTQLNSNIEAVQTILTALEENDYIVDVTKIAEDGVEIGYSFTFANSGTINIYHGNNGADGSTPEIGIRKASDGEYYWTSDDEWLTDESGDKIPAAYSDAGSNTPLFRVSDEIWYISFDNGNTWCEMQTGDDEKECPIFQAVYIEEDHYIFHLSDGTTFSVPAYDPEAPVSQYAGKIISIMGDSISTFKGCIPAGNATWYPRGEVNSSDKTWWSLLLGLTGAELGINNSWSGSRVSNTSETNSGNLGPDRCMPSLARIESLDDNGTPDIILFFGGTNDINNGVSLGSFDKNALHTTVDLTTTIFGNFADAYKTAIMRMQHFYPYAKIICITPMYKGASDNYNKRLDSFITVIKDISDYFGIHCVDLRKCGINIGNYAPQYGLMIDALHPDAKGMEMIANYLYLQMNNMITFGDSAPEAEPEMPEGIDLGEIEERTSPLLLHSMTAIRNI